MATAADKFRSLVGDITVVLSVGHESCLVATNRFYSRGMIGESLRREICERKGAEAVNLLLDGLSAALEVNPSRLEDVIEILSEEPSLCEVFKKIKEAEPNSEAPGAATVIGEAPQVPSSHIDPNIVVSQLQDVVQCNPDAILAVNDLCSKFDDLFTSASTSLQHVKLDELKLPLESKLARTPKAVKDRFCPLLRKISSVSQFFSFILEHKFCGFLNFNLLSIYIGRFGSETLKRKMSEYETFFRSFSKAIKMQELLNSILKNPNLPKPLAPIGLPMAECLLEESWFSRSYNSFLEVLSSVYSWSISIMFNDIREKCIIVDYALFGEEEMERIIEDINSSEKRQLLKECGITVTLHTQSKPKIDEQKQSESRIHKLEESVTCSLCKGLFKDPKVLSCHHSFCLACLERVHETEAGCISCPVCRKMEKLPKDGVRGLSAAYHITPIVEIAEMLNIKDTTVPVSDKECGTADCGKTPVAWCGTCNNLCENCMISHSKMAATKNHVIRLITELQRERDVPLVCQRHEEQHRQYYCMDCNNIVCPKCLKYCSDCNKLFCDDCSKEHGYYDPEKGSSLTIEKTGMHSVHLLKDLIKDCKAREKELERGERELKSIDEAAHLYLDNLKSNVEKMRENWSSKITSRRDDYRKGREAFTKAGQTAEHFIRGERTISSPEQTFKSLVEYSSNEASFSSIFSNTKDSSDDIRNSDANAASSSSRVWLQWSVDDESKNMEMIEQIQPCHISVEFPAVDPFHASKDNWFHISLIDLFSVRPSGDPPIPNVIIKGVNTGSFYSSSIKPVGNMTWFVLFNASRDKLIEVSVFIDGVEAQKSPFKFKGVYNDEQSPQDELENAQT